MLGFIIMPLCGLRDLLPEKFIPSHLCAVRSGVCICIYELSELLSKEGKTSAFVVLGAHAVTACGVCGAVWKRCFVLLEGSLHSLCSDTHIKKYISINGKVLQRSYRRKVTFFKSDVTFLCNFTGTVI